MSSDERRFFSIFFGIIFISFIPLTAKDGIRIETYRASEIQPHIKDIVNICNHIYREYPYLYNGEHAGYQSYLESYSQRDHSIICCAYDGSKVIGFAAGIPMVETKDLYKETLLENGYRLENLFYLGEFGLEPQYRWQGIEEALYDKIESHARRKGFETICLWELDDSAHTQYRPQEYIPKDELLNKLGFVSKPYLNFQIFWTNIDELQESAHLAVYWTKTL